MGLINSVQINTMIYTTHTHRYTYKSRDVKKTNQPGKNNWKKQANKKK